MFFLILSSYFQNSKRKTKN